MPSFILYQGHPLFACPACFMWDRTMRAWRHPDRTAIFVGDLIDRGPKQVETVKLVRGTVDTGAELTIMATTSSTPSPVPRGIRSIRASICVGTIDRGTARNTRPFWTKSRGS